MRKMMIMALTVVMLAQTGIAQKAPSAKQIMDEAFAKAKQENKNVFVIFTGSICGVCKLMDKLMQEPEISKYFTDNYVITHLYSRGDTTIKNDGAEEYYKKGRGAYQEGSGGKSRFGIPFWVIFNSAGELVQNSVYSKETPDKGLVLTNMACPIAKEERVLFKNILKNTSKIDAEGLEKIDALSKVYYDQRFPDKNR